MVSMLKFQMEGYQFDTTVDMHATTKEECNTGTEDEISMWFQILYESCNFSIQYLR